MVTKSTTKKHKIFSKKYTRKNKYGGELGTVTGTEKPNYISLYTQNYKDGMKMEEAKEKSGYNEWVKQNSPQGPLTGTTKPDFMKLYNENKSKGMKTEEAKEKSGYNEWVKQNTPEIISVAPEVSSTSVAPEVSSTSIALEIQIPSLVDKDLFNKALASNVDVLIEKSLTMNDFSYFLEKQKEQQEQQSELQLIPNDIQKAFETSNRDVEQILAFGGSKYFISLDSGNNNATKWLNIFKKYKQLISLFSSDQTGDIRRRTEIDRFNLFLEMMSFYHDTKEDAFGIITNSGENLIDTLRVYHRSIPRADKNDQNINQDNFIDTFSQITINEEKAGEYFVRFVLFNNSINRLFSINPNIITQDTPPSVSVNIFQMDESSTASTEYRERTLTDELPKKQIAWSDIVNQNNFFTQFRTNVWNLEYINNNFFKDRVNTGDNISVLVRSTILYVISKIFNNTDIKTYINNTTIKNSRDLKKKLFEAFPNVSTSFLFFISKNFFPINYEEHEVDDFDLEGNNIPKTIDNNNELIEQQKIVKNFLTSSRTKTNINEVALPYNIFFNLYNRDGDTKYITNIPNNIINSSALSFVNDLELFLTLNKYLTDTTITQIRQIQEQRANITNTQNIHNTTNGTNSVEIEHISVSGHINPNIRLRNNLIPNMLQREPIQEQLPNRVIEAKLHQEPLTVQESAFDFQSNLTSSLPIFDSTPPRIIPVDCKLQTHIEYLGGIPNATIDCQRACLMSQIVYEPTKAVRLFNFENCWGRNETLDEGKGLKYLCPYQPDYGYGKYTQDITAGVNPINRFNNAPYVKNERTDNLDLMNYNYVEHTCHVWIDDHLKRVYVVFRGSISSHDWWYTDRTIAQGLGFQEGRLLQIKEILRDVYKKLNSYAAIYTNIPGTRRQQYTDGRPEYKLIFAGHSLGGFLAIMSAAVVFNNNVFNYPNTFQKATSITFNPWFPPETVGVQGVVDFYIPIINYGTTCALAFGICQDAAERTIIPSCSTNDNQFTGCTPGVTTAYYLNKVKGPFYYYLVRSWASLSITSLPKCHSVHNFYGAVIQRRIFDFTTDYISLYDDLPENINKKYNYLDMLFPELNKPGNGRVCSIIPGSTMKPALDCGVNVTTNIVLGGNYRLPLPDIHFVPGIIALVWSDNRSNVAVTVDPVADDEFVHARDAGGGKKYKTVIKKTSKKLRKRRSKRTTKKIRK